ncbi:unnamed protein product [Closterium sp. NIES-64]|nr:unnamed protein product [Closterium sp. NIES-64]
MGPKGLITSAATSHPTSMTPVLHCFAGHGTQGAHQPPPRLQTCIICPTLTPVFPLSSPQRSTIALVMGPKGLISRLLAPKFRTGATVELHRQEYHRIFKAHTHVPFEKVTNLLQRLDRELFGVRYSFPLMRLDDRGRPRRVEGLSWGGARRGKAFALQRQGGNPGRATRSGTTDDGGVENATASSDPSVPPLPVGGGGYGEGMPSTFSVPTLPVGGGGDVEGLPATPSVPPLPAGDGGDASGSMPLPTAPPSTMNGMPADRPVCSHPRASARGTVPRHRPSSPSLDDTPEQRRIAFDRGVDELKLLGFDVKGIISDQGTTFRGAAAERKLDHQVDWWHVKRTLYNLFCKELQDQMRMAVEVDKASCIEELWLAKMEDLRQWLRTKGLEKEAKGTLKASLVEAVCDAMGTIAYVKMTPDEAQWKFPELRKVRRLGGERAVVDVPVGYGEVRPDTAGEMQPIVRDDADDEADAGATQVDVQWADVEE